MEDVEHNKVSAEAVNRLLYTRVASFNNSPELDDPQSIETPWFDGWKRDFLENFEESDHEFSKGYFGCVYALMAHEINDFKSVLSNLQSKVNSLSSVKWFFSNFMKYFIIVNSDPTQTYDNFRQNENFPELISYCGPNSCFWFDLIIDGSSASVNHTSSASINSYSIQQNIDTNNRNRSSTSRELILDPLSLQDSPPASSGPDSDHGVSSLNPSVEQKSISQSSSQTGESCLRSMIEETMIPWTEKRMKLLYEMISKNRGMRKSFFNIPKGIFNPVGPFRGNNAIYKPEADEMQQRKFADLAMCLGLHEMAYNFYHGAKKEFQAEGASLYYAGACEMTAATSFLLNKYQKNLFHQAISTYLDSCNSYSLGSRAALLASDVIRSLYPNDAAYLFIQMTSEDSDLRSALFLEQAAKCFFVSSTPRKRKSAFYYVIAGHRYNKCGLRKHALHSYTKYSFPHWTFALEHVNCTIDRLKLQLAANSPSSSITTSSRDMMSVHHHDTHEKPDEKQLCVNQSIQ